MGMDRKKLETYYGPQIELYFLALITKNSHSSKFPSLVSKHETAG
jgi:hypothetical protein